MHCSLIKRETAWVEDFPLDFAVSSPLFINIKCGQVATIHLVSYRHINIKSSVLEESLETCFFSPVFELSLASLI